MKSLIYIFVFIISNAIAESKDNSLVGSWLGFCEPISEQSGSRMCSYQYVGNNAGVYSCRFFSDLRCDRETEKKTSFKFTYKLLSKGRIKIINSKNSEFEYELNRYVLSENLLVLRGIEVKKKDDEKAHNASVGPFFFTRLKKD